jgi:flagellar protein FlbD
VIALTRLDGAEILVNVDLIESVEPTPDTLITLVNGTKLFVLEAPQEIVDRVIAFKRAVHAGPRLAAVRPDADPEARA